PGLFLIIHRVAIGSMLGILFAIKIPCPGFVSLLYRSEWVRKMGELENGDCYNERLECRVSD
ncbi:MAG: hypothetical protein ACI92E_003039, partial [Oceanicoccus sp.]